MNLKLYYFLVSQPSRAIYIFLKKNSIPFESNIIHLGKKEHLQEGYEKIHPFRKVPAIDHNGFKLFESVAILRYLCRQFKVDDHWYPADSKAQAKVDEYLEWQHLNTRYHCDEYFDNKFMLPLKEGRTKSFEEIANYKGRMMDCLDQIENIWLKDKPFLIGEKITIADILAACEIEEPRLAGYEPRNERPILTSWLDRVNKETHPYYEEAHAQLNKLIDKYNGKRNNL